MPGMGIRVGASCLIRARARGFTLHIRLHTLIEFSYIFPPPLPRPFVPPPPRASTYTHRPSRPRRSRCLACCLACPVLRPPPSSVCCRSGMPSLRRTFSSPPTRRGPYSYPSSLSSSGAQTRAGPNQPRRSSGSDVSNRRVLADIDWWIVQDGQRDIYDASTGGRTLTDASENDADVDLDASGTTPTAPAQGEGVDAILSAWQPTPSIGVTAPETSMLPVPFFGDIAMEGSFGGGSPEVSLISRCIVMSPLPCTAPYPPMPRRSKLITICLHAAPLASVSVRRLDSSTRHTDAPAVHPLGRVLGLLLFFD